MLTATKNLKLPHFDVSDFIIEMDMIFSAYQAMKPLKSGDIVPSFTFKKHSSIWQQFSNGVETFDPVFFQQLTNRPLIISFYSTSWKMHGLGLLKQMQELQRLLSYDKGNVLIICAEKEEKAAIKKMASDNRFSLNFYFDTKNKIAKEFGIYSENNPTWNRFSGIDVNIPLLATYGISPQHDKIVFDYIDWDLEANFPHKEIIYVISRINK